MAFIFYFYFTHYIFSVILLGKYAEFWKLMKIIDVWENFIEAAFMFLWICVLQNWHFWEGEGVLFLHVIWIPTEEFTLTSATLNFHSYLKIENLKNALKPGM